MIIFMSTRGKIKLFIFLIMTAEEGRIVVFKEPVPNKGCGHIVKTGKIGRASCRERV